VKSEPQPRHEPETDLVRCLECGTVYRKPRSDQESGPCPTCGYVGWIALESPFERNAERSN